MTIQNPGQAVLDSGALPYELSLADVEAGELLLLDEDAIRANQDPFRIPTRNLGFLAHSRGVLLWDDDWPELTKRQWIADQWKFKALRGTEEALHMALALWGFTLVQVLTPPQGFYLSEEFTAEERDAWIKMMPQIRVQVGETVGVGPVDEWFLGDAYLGEAFLMLNDGPELYGRRGFLRYRGVDIPLQSTAIAPTAGQSPDVHVEQIDVAGLSTVGAFLGVDFLGEDGKYLGAAEQEVRTTVISLNRQADQATDILGLTMASLGFKPQDTRYHRVSDVRQEGAAWFLDVDFLGEAYLTVDDAGSMLADVLYLLDPAVAAPMTEGVSFLGVDRLGMEANTAELMIDLHELVEPDATILGHSYLGEGYLIPQDLSAQDKACRAVMAAKALRDTVLVSFAPRRPLQFSDPIGPDTKAGEWVADRL